LKICAIFAKKKDSMFDYSESVIHSLIVHRVRTYGEGCVLSEKATAFSNENPMTPLLMQFFTNSFKPDIQYVFSGGDDNMVSKLVSHLFEDPSAIVDVSAELANELHNCSTHPNIKSGDFYCVIIDNLKLYGELFRCIGLFKSESTETYLKVSVGGGAFSVNEEKGVSLKKVDKGALILRNTSGEMFVMAMDAVAKKDEAVFWKEQFLKLEPREDNFFFTHNYLDLCKHFVTDVYNSENRVSKTEQIDLLNRSIDYFSKNKAFEVGDFESKVIENPEVINAFKEYREFFETERNVPLQQAFNIEEQAVKKQKRYFKSVLKLDKNFHVYVHGNQNLIERGYDQQKGMHYYRLYFDYESD
jgi:hypothetical protein